MSKFGYKNKALPEGWEYVEPTLTALENELRDVVCVGTRCAMDVKFTVIISRIPSISVQLVNRFHPNSL